MKCLALGFSLVCALILPSFAQQPSQPPKIDKPEFFGDLLAVMSFCGLTRYVDQYRLATGMKYFGVTSADRPAMEAAREKHYAIYRSQFRTATQHGDFCLSVNQHPFLNRVMRSRLPVAAGSDPGNQQEKAEVFGNVLGALYYCNLAIDSEKWGHFLFDMGVQSETVTSLNEQAVKVRTRLVEEYGTPQHGHKTCVEVRNNPNINRFSR